MPGGDGQVRRPRLPDAGWLPDPSVIGVERWWDGRRWTSRTRDSATGLDCVDPRWTAAEDRAPTAPSTLPQREPRRFTPILEGRTEGLRSARERDGWYAGFAALGVMVVFTVAYVGIVTGTFHWPTWGAVVPTGPAVEYPVFGSDALSLYLARSLVAQEEQIDISWMGGSGESVREQIDDAMLEVAAQNPYVYVDPTGWVLSDDGLALIPSYRYGDAEADSRRAQTAAVVERIVASDEVTGAVGDVALLQALHDALVETAAFDDAAFAASQGSLTTSTYSSVMQAEEAYGAVVARAAVGEGYAKAFHALADAVGYESVVVTGTATDGEDVFPHSWNRVLVGGAWFVVDVAWDDGGAAEEGDDYFLLGRQDPLLATRAIDADWVVDEQMWIFGN